MNSIIDVFANLSPLYWFGLAFILVMLEVIIGANFFLLWLGASAATVGGAMLLYAKLPWEFQFILFAVVSVACLLYWDLHLKHKLHKSDQPHLNRRNEQYIGREVTLLEPIVNGRGRISIDDSSWRIEGADMPEGTVVKIFAVDGVVLKVKRV